MKPTFTIYYLTWQKNQLIYKVTKVIFHRRYTQINVHPNIQVIAE